MCVCVCVLFPSRANSFSFFFFSVNVVSVDVHYRVHLSIHPFTYPSSVCLFHPLLLFLLELSNENFSILTCLLNNQSMCFFFYCLYQCLCWSPYCECFLILLPHCQYTLVYLSANLDIFAKLLVYYDTRAII